MGNQFSTDYSATVGRILKILSADTHENSIPTKCPLARLRACARNSWITRIANFGLILILVLAFVNSDEGTKRKDRASPRRYYFRTKYVSLSTDFSWLSSAAEASLHTLCSSNEIGNILRTFRKCFRGVVKNGNLPSALSLRERGQLPRPWLLANVKILTLRKGLKTMFLDQKNTRFLHTPKKIYEKLTVKDGG